MRSIVAAFGLMFLLPVGAFATGWSWEMPGEVYKELDFGARAGVDRAAKIFREACEAERRNVRVTDLVPRFRAAVAEWRKVQIQAEAENFDETLISYAIFMQAYSRERAHDRNEAVKLYSELVDLHPDIQWVVIAAKYRLARCRFSLGENRKGDAIIDEFIAEKEYEGHPLMGEALDSLGWRCWGQGKWDDALDAWRQILDVRYMKCHRDLWNSIHDRIIVISLVTGNYSHFDEMVMACAKEGDDKEALERCKWAVQCAYNAVVWNWWNGFGDRCAERYPKEDERKKKLEQSYRSFVGWFKGKKGLYEKTGHATDYLFASLRVALRFDSEANAKEIFENVRNYLRGEKKPEVLNARVNEAIGTLVERGKFDWARTLPDLMKGVHAQCWARYEIERRADKWKEAAQHLEEYIGHKPGAAALKNAQWVLADIYRERIGQVEKAVKIYQELNDPPSTLWRLVDCYRRLGKKKEAYQILNELASIFEKEAARAIYYSAYYREQDGEKKTAIALYKRLLTHPEWKKSGESSQAHQALERLGVATGGAMTNEVR